jgi:hypothetical protein
MATMWRTFRHDGKNAQVRVGACPPPFTISTITYKVVVYAPAAKADALPLFLLYPYGPAYGAASGLRPELVFIYDLAHWKILVRNWFFCRLTRKPVFCLSTNAIHKKLRCFVDFFQKIDSFWKRLIRFKRQIEPSLFRYLQYLLWVVLMVFLVVNCFL